MNKILLIGFVLTITIGLAGCGETTLDQNMKWSEKVLSGGSKEKKAKNVENYKNVEEIDITDTKGEVLKGTLRQAIQPGKLWKGYVPISADGATMDMPAAVRFKADGMIEVYSIGPGEKLIRTDDEQFIIDKVSYIGNGDPNELSDAEKLIKEKDEKMVRQFKETGDHEIVAVTTDMEGNVLDSDDNVVAYNDKNAKAETDVHTIRTITEFDKALDKNHIMDSGKVILMFTYDNSLLGKYEHSIKTTEDGGLLLNLNQMATYHLQ